MGFIDEIKAKAKSCKKTIVLPESEDIRTYEAAEAILKEGTANLILIGSEEEIAKNKGDFDITGATIVDPATYEKTDEYVATLVELRKKKGMTEEQAREILLTNYLYYGVMMAALAEEKHVIIGEAMTIYHMPIYKKLKELLETGVLGKVNLITMNFGSFKEYDMNNRFFNRNLAGGAMLDIGVYALSFIRWFMDSKPDQLLSQVKAAPTGVDEQAGLLLMNPEGQMATVMLSLHSKQPKKGMISCEKGYIEIMEYPRAWESRITYVETGDTEVVRAGENADALAYELADMEKAIAGDEECMHFEYTKDVMDMMTEFRKSWKFTYPEEE